MREVIPKSFNHDLILIIARYYDWRASKPPELPQLDISVPDKYLTIRLNKDLML